MTITTKQLFLGTGFVLLTASVFMFNMSSSDNANNTPINYSNAPEEREYSEFEQRSIEIITNQEGEVITLEGDTDPSLIDYANMSVDALKELFFPSDDPAWKWAQVDMDGLEDEMPDNSYWTFAAPTQDEALIEFRKENKAYWEKEWGQINSNNAPEEKIRAYYANQYKVSTDYVLFSNRMLEKYRHVLPEQDVSFQILARNLNLAKLEELPRKLARSIELHEKHIQRREEWLADKETFEANLQAEKAERML